MAHDTAMILCSDLHNIYVNSKHSYNGAELRKMKKSFSPQTAHKCFETKIINPNYFCLESLEWILVYY